MALSSEETLEPLSKQTVLKDSCFQAKTLIKDKNLTALKLLFLLNPDFVNESGFLGSTPLHQASLIGDFNICQFLISNGADLNSTNNAGETPLLQVCQNGSLKLLFLILTAPGLNLAAIDKRGRSCITHAVSKGQIHVVHFLHEKLKFPFVVPDLLGRTLLHVAAENNEIHMIRYLLRNNRVDTTIKDHRGQTALHIAARQCYSEVCQYLLRDSFHLLLIEDQNSHTALDLSKMQQSSSRLEYQNDLIEFLTDCATYSLSNEVPTPIHNSDKEKKWLAIIPCLATIFISLIFCLLPLWFFITVIIGSLYIARTSLQKKITRQPSPLLVSVFGTVLLLIFICLFGFILPVIATVSIVLPTLGVAITIFFAYYFAFLLRNDAGLQVDHDMDFDNVLKYEVDVGKFCYTCEHVKKFRTKHCKTCDVCIEGFDHHCAWLNKDIGKNNHRQFIGLLAFLVIGSIYFLFNSVLYFSMLLETPIKQLIFVIPLIYRTLPFPALMFSISIPFCYMIASLLRMQLKVIGIGLTTNEALNQEKYGIYVPSHISWNDSISNLTRFFQGGPWGYEISANFALPTNFA